jgi:hypothetical protein
MENGQVRFRWRDSRHNNRSSIMKLEAAEFMRRFLLHVLPAGFMKIRYFGLLANRNRRQALALCRLHLRATAADIDTLLTEQQSSALNRSCPQCQSASSGCCCMVMGWVVSGLDMRFLRRKRALRTTFFSCWAKYLRSNDLR